MHLCIYPGPGHDNGALTPWLRNDQAAVVWDFDPATWIFVISKLTMNTFDIHVAEAEILNNGWMISKPVKERRGYDTLSNV